MTIPKMQLQKKIFSRSAETFPFLTLYINSHLSFTFFLLQLNKQDYASKQKRKLFFSLDKLMIKTISKGENSQRSPICDLSAMHQWRSLTFCSPVVTSNCPPPTNPTFLKSQKFTSGTGYKISFCEAIYSSLYVWSWLTQDLPSFLWLNSIL